LKNQSTRKLEKDLLKLHTKDFTDTDKLTILHLILDGKIADAKDILKPQGVPEKDIKKERRCLQINYVTFKTSWKVKS